MFLSAVMCGKRLKAWNTVPIERRCRSSASSRYSIGLSFSTTVPLVGYSSPATIRSRVDLPPPDGPISARQCTPSSSRLTRSITVCVPNRFTTVWRLSFIFEAAFEPARPERDRHGENKITNREREISLEVIVVDAAGLLRALGELGNGDDREQRRVLDQ